MGLITLAPALSSGLEMKSFQGPTFPYVDIEQLAPKKPCLIIFAGEALSRLTAGYFHAPLHRVVSTSIRYAMPFFFRPQAHKPLDAQKLKSAFLEKHYFTDKQGGQDHQQLSPITADELEVLVQRQYRMKKIPVELGEFKKIPYYEQLFEEEALEEMRKKKESKAEIRTSIP
jgi:hypothetical protein